MALGREELGASPGGDARDRGGPQAVRADRKRSDAPRSPAGLGKCNFDAVRAKVQDEGLVRNKDAASWRVYLGIGVTCADRKEVLGLWIEQTEGARFWFAVMNELKARARGTC